jgi:hypothetical protein
VIASEYGRFVYLFDCSCNQRDFVDDDTPPAQSSFDLFQFDEVAGKVLTLVPLKVDLVSHFRFFGGGEFYLAPDVVDKGSC